MSGHNRWSTIKHKKAAADAKKSKGWTKLIKEVTIAARSGGDPANSPQLRSAIDKARAANVPNDTIERAIRKGSGQDQAEQMEELVYQVYGPGGVAIVIELATDNRNRTASELRKLLERQNAKIDSSGSVLHKFKKRGQLLFDSSKYTEDAITEVALWIERRGKVLVGRRLPGGLYGGLWELPQGDDAAAAARAAGVGLESPVPA